MSDSPASDNLVDPGRRTWVAITVGAGAIGGIAAAVPFVASMLPSERAKAAGAPVEVDVSNLEPGQKMVVEWRGKPVWVVRRTPEMLKAVKIDDDRVADPDTTRSVQPPYAKNAAISTGCPSASICQ